MYGQLESAQIKKSAIETELAAGVAGYLDAQLDNISDEFVTAIEKLDKKYPDGKPLKFMELVGGAVQKNWPSVYSVLQIFNRKN